MSEPRIARQLVTEAAAHAEGRQACSRQETTGAVDASWRERALNAEEALSQSAAKIRARRRHIGELMARIRDLELDLPADAVQRLTTESTTLKQQLRTLAADHRTLTNRLAAARDNNHSQPPCGRERARPVSRTARDPPRTAEVWAMCFRGSAGVPTGSCAILCATSSACAGRTTSVRPRRIRPTTPSGPSGTGSAPW